MHANGQNDLILIFNRDQARSQRNVFRETFQNWRVRHDWAGAHWFTDDFTVMIVRPIKVEFSFFEGITLIYFEFKKTDNRETELYFIGNLIKMFYFFLNILLHFFQFFNFWLSKIRKKFKFNYSNNYQWFNI